MNDLNDPKYPLKSYGTPEKLIISVHIVWLFIVLYYFFKKAFAFELTSLILIRILCLLLIGLFAPTLIFLLRTKYFRWALVKDKKSGIIVAMVWIFMMLGLYYTTGA